MAIREISAELWGAISGGNGHSNYEAGGAGKKNSRQSTIQRGAGVDIYKDLSVDCLVDIGMGIIGGLKKGPAGMISGMVANSYNSCVREPNRNSNGGGSISPGQCTW